MSEAEKMREACADRVAICANVAGVNGRTDEAIVLRELSEKVRALPLPAPSAVEEAERVFLEEADVWCIAAVRPYESAGTDASRDGRLLDARDALLTAREAAGGGA